jgi:hypothetical protein
MSLYAPLAGSEGCGTSERSSRFILPRSDDPTALGQRARVSVFEKPPFPDAASGDYSLVSTRTDHHGVDFRTIPHHDEVCDDRRPAIGEVDGEGASTIGVHRVSALGRSVGEIGDDLTVNRYRIDLGKPIFAIELSHRRAHLWARGSLAAQFIALDGESQK